MKLERALWHSTAGLSLMAGAQPAFAQNTVSPASAETTVPDSGQLDDITVTARRVSENQQTVPVSVTAFTPQDIVNRGSRTIEDLALGTPSVSITPATATKNAAVVSIRGQVQTDNLMTSDASVGLYVNDIYYARAYAALSDLLDVSSIEVLKGPQGTLYGRNTIGGAIKIVTTPADAAGPMSGYIRGSYGNFDAVDLTGAINIPIVKDVLAVRFAAAYRNHDGYTRSYLVPINPATGVATSLTPIRNFETDDQDSQSYRLSLRLTPTEDLSINVAGSYFRSKDNGVLIADPTGDIQNYSFDATPASFTTSPQRRASFYAALTDAASLSKTTLKTLDSTIEWQATDTLTAKLIVGYVESFNRTVINADGGVVGGFGYFSFEPSLLQKQHQSSVEFQILGTALDENLTYVTGAYYFDEKGSEAQPNTTSHQFNANASTNFVGDVDNQSKSVFANLGYSLTDRFRAGVGLRYTWDDKELDGHTRDLSTPATRDRCFYLPGPDIVTSTTPGGPCGFLTKTSADYLTYEVSVDYRVTPDVFLYAKIGNGYRSGGAQLRGLGGPTSIPFEPDKVMSYEAGVKSELLDRHVRLNASYYHTDYTNIQQASFGAVATQFGNKFAAFIINAGSAKVDGVEVETVVNVGNGISLSGGLGYVDFRFNNSALIRPQTPKWTYQVAADLRHATGIGKINAHLSYSGKSSFYMPGVSSAAVPMGKIAGFGLLDGRLGLELENGLGFAVFGKNLLDKQYYSQGFSTAYNPNGPFNPGAGLVPFYGVRGKNIGAPRTYGVEASFKF